MNELYLDKYKNEMFKIFGMKEEKAEFKPKVSYDFQFRYLNANFNLLFGRPISETCKILDQIGTKEIVVDEKEITPQQVQHVTFKQV